MSKRFILALLFIIMMVLVLPSGLVGSTAAAGDPKRLIYDEAGLLTEEQYRALNDLANQSSAKRETDFIIYTTKNSENVDVMKLAQDFYEEHGSGYDKAHGNAAILTLDMNNRELYLAGFYKAKEYLDDSRMDRIRDKITPDLSSGDYELAFQKFIKTSSKYMGVRPGVNPDNILFNGWFQLAVALGIGGGIVGMMAHTAGGRVTVQRQTYEDRSTSGVLDHRDMYLRTTVTKRKIEKENNNNSGGGGSGSGGGTTSGGHSHSGSRGSF